MNISYSTSVGKVRSHNEDSFLCLPPWRDIAFARGRCLFAVADGLGGHENGEVASALAVQTLKKWLADCREHPLLPEHLETVFQEINSLVCQQATKAEDFSNIGTTLTALVVTGDKAFIAHVGDSRVYLLRSGEWKQLTRDHSLLGDQIRTGKITWEAAKIHPAKHILTRAVGVRDFMDIDITSLELKQDDVFILCTDGIHGLIPDHRMKEIVFSSPFHKIAHHLVSAANSAGGLDNSTAVVVQIGSLPVFYPPRFSWYRLKKTILDWWLSRRF